MPIIYRTKPGKPDLDLFVDGQPMRLGALNALARHVSLLYDTLLAGFRTRKPVVGVRFGAGSSQTLPSSTNQFIGSLTTSIVDTELLHPDGPGGYATQLRVRTSGLYLVNAHATVASSAASATRIVLLLIVNGTQPATDTGAMQAGWKSSSTTGSSASLSTLLPLVAGTRVYMTVLQESGSTLSVDTSNGGAALSAEWIAPLGL